jgi:hypothetical protein
MSALGMLAAFAGLVLVVCVYLIGAAFFGLHKDADPGS